MSAVCLSPQTLYPNTGPGPGDEGNPDVDEDKDPDNDQEDIKTKADGELPEVSEDPETAMVEGNNHEIKCF